MNNKLRILGSVSPYCKNNCNCPGYLIENNSKILLDCGPGVTSRLVMPNDLENLTVIISHLHKDHYSDLFALGYASLCYHRMGLLKNKIKVYIPETSTDSDEYLDYQIIKRFKECYFDVIIYNQHDEIKIDNNIITFYKTHHSIPNYSCKIQNSDFNLVYTGDMGYKNISSYIDFVNNVDCLISEATYLEVDNIIDENHLHAKEAAYIAYLANVKMLLLTHFWPEHNKTEYLEEAKLFFPNVMVADENLDIDLNDLKNKGKCR